jgi:hypothetical protein
MRAIPVDTTWAWILSSLMSSAMTADVTRAPRSTSGDPQRLTGHASMASLM